jgi:hypothetical protein
MKITRVIFLTLLIPLLLLTYMGIGYSAEVKNYSVTWDKNVPDPEGYRVFERREGEAYDYSSPIWEGEFPPANDITTPLPIPEMPVQTGLVGSWNKDASEIYLDWNIKDAVPNEEVRYVIVRAYEGSRESADSEEVSVTMRTENQVVLWRVYYSEDEQNWIELDAIQRAEGSRLTKPLTVVPEGEEKLLYFTIVAFGAGDTFSENATPVAVLIDRTELGIPSNVKITVTIPVE